MELHYSSVWADSEIGELSTACLRSFGCLDLQISLYVYEKQLYVPKTVILEDVKSIVPAE